MTFLLLVINKNYGVSVLKFYWNLRESMAEIVLDHCYKVLFCFSDTVTHSFTSSLMIIF